MWFAKHKKRILSFLFRWMVVNIVFLAVKATMEHENGMFEAFFTATSMFYYFTAFFLFFFTWELNNWYIKRQKQKGGLSFKSRLQILAKTMFWVVVVSSVVYYLGLFPFREPWGIICEQTPEKEFITDFMRAVVMGLTVVFFNMYYHLIHQREALQKQMEDLQKEMLASKYASLKSQISPHFLFNSLNTLTSLMYEDRDLASDFVTRLASSYRYILDNKEEDLVSLEKELAFLDAYIFMMEVRHKNAVSIAMDINLDAARFSIPTLSLQMLLENALKHNYYSKEQPLEVTISTIGEDALVVKNTLRKRNLSATTGLGLDNIKKRYSYYTNKQVLVREETDFFEVIIPLLTQEMEQNKLLSIS